MEQLSVSGRVRKDILEAAFRAGKKGAHIAPSLSIVEIMLAVFGGDYAEGKDEFILSKGHGALGYYAAMKQKGMITAEQFLTFEDNGGEFPGQPSRTTGNHVTYSGGSLGMGLPYGVGRAWITREKGNHIYVLMGDGELNEGSVWEAAILAAQLKLANLVAIVDYNGMQSDGNCGEIVQMNLEQLWAAAGWNMVCCDGHVVEELNKAFEQKGQEGPTVVLARTVKGKGVSFMENNNEWHHHTLSKEQYADAVDEIGEKYGL